MHQQRRKTILELLQSKPFVSFKELEGIFPDISSMTLRRDIEMFEKNGEALRVRGGARSMKYITLTVDDPIESRSIENKREKEKIARIAAKYFEHGRSIFIDSGSTAAQLIKCMPEGRIIVTTTAPDIALSLLKYPDVMVNLVGGMINKDNISISGQQALNYIKDINIDIAFIVPSGISVENGLTCGNYNEAEVKRAVMEKSKINFVLFDSSKIDKNLPYTFSKLEKVHHIITDKELPENFKIFAQSKNIPIESPENQ